MDDKEDDLRIRLKKEEAELRYVSDRGNIVYERDRHIREIEGRIAELKVKLSRIEETAMTDRTAAERLAAGRLYIRSETPPKTQDYITWLEAALNTIDERDAQIARLQQERDDAFADHVRVHKDKCDCLEREQALIQERDAALKELKEYGEDRDLIHRAAELIKTSEAHDRAGQLAAALQERDAAKAEARTMRNAAVNLTKERDTATREAEATKQSLLSLMRHNSIATGHGDTTADLIGEINAWCVARRVETETLKEEVGRLRAAIALAENTIVTEADVQRTNELAAKYGWQTPTQPSADDVERARNALAELDYRHDHLMKVAAAITAAREQSIAKGRAEMREMVLAYGEQECFPLEDMEAIRSFPTTPTGQGEEE